MRTAYNIKDVNARNEKGMLEYHLCYYVHFATGAYYSHCWFCHCNKDSGNGACPHRDCEPLSQWEINNLKDVGQWDG